MSKATHIRRRALPPLRTEKASYFAMDDQGQWFRLTAANTWEPCPPLEMRLGENG